MKAIVYSALKNETLLLIHANNKRHVLTFVSNALDLSTIKFSIGKSVIIISTRDTVNAQFLQILWEQGIRKIITRSKDTSHIDLVQAAILGIKIANNPTEDQSDENTVIQTLKSLDDWENGHCLEKACCSIEKCNNRNTENNS
ncbi:MAG: lactate dehydrogenase [Sphingobacterium siyangense]